VRLGASIRDAAHNRSSSLHIGEEEIAEGINAGEMGKPLEMEGY